MTQPETPGLDCGAFALSFQRRRESRKSGDVGVIRRKKQTRKCKRSGICV